MGDSRPRLEPREVEQVLNKSCQAACLSGNHLCQLVPLLGIQSGGVDAARGRADGSQRRAEVVRHGSQERRLQVVAAAQRLRLDELLLEHAAATPGLEQRAQRGHEPLHFVGGRIALDQQRPDAVALGHQRDRALLGIAIDPALQQVDPADPVVLGDPPCCPLERVGLRTEHRERELGGEVGFAPA